MFSYQAAIEVSRTSVPFWQVCSMLDSVITFSIYRHSCIKCATMHYELLLAELEYRAFWKLAQDLYGTSIEVALTWWILDYHLSFNPLLYVLAVWSMHNSGNIWSRWKLWVSPAFCNAHILPLHLTFVSWYIQWRSDCNNTKLGGSSGRAVEVGEWNWIVSV